MASKKHPNEVFAEACGLNPRYPGKGPRKKRL